MKMRVERDQWVKSHIKNMKGTLLDVGAGSQPFRQACEEAGLKYYSLDKYSLYDREKDPSIKVEWDYVKPDYDCTLEDFVWNRVQNKDISKFDNILLTDVLEHVPNANNYLEYCAAMLKPAGTILLTHPYASLVHMAPHHYYSGFSRYWYEYWLPKLGMKIDEITLDGDYIDWLRQEIGQVFRKDVIVLKCDYQNSLDHYVREICEVIDHHFKYDHEKANAILNLGIYVKATKL